MDYATRNARANAICKKETVILNTAFGKYQIHSFTQDCWAICHPVGVRADRWNQRSFALHGGHADSIVSGKREI